MNSYSLDTAVNTDEDDTLSLSLFHSIVFHRNQMGANASRGHASAQIRNRTTGRSMRSVMHYTWGGTSNHRGTRAPQSYSASRSYLSLIERDPDHDTTDIHDFTQYTSRHFSFRNSYTGIGVFSTAIEEKRRDTLQAEWKVIQDTKASEN